jgi:hypothetical protein
MLSPGQTGAKYHAYDMVTDPDNSYVTGTIREDQKSTYGKGA